MSGSSNNFQFPIRSIKSWSVTFATKLRIANNTSSALHIIRNIVRRGFLDAAPATATNNGSAVQVVRMMFVLQCCLLQNQDFRKSMIAANV